MTRPEIIRADSIDLQDREAPSAKNHTPRPSPLNTSLSAANGTAPHQAETLREVAAGQAEEELHSPRVSWVNGGETGDLQSYAQDLAAGVTSSLNANNMAARQQDDLAVAQNGGLETEDADLDGDDGDLDDDDMMDKISSSPSIDDGGSPICHPPLLQPLHPCASPCSSPASACFSEARSSSPYLDQPDYLPLQTAHGPADKSPAALSRRRRHHHLRGSPLGRLGAHAGQEDTAPEADGLANLRSSGPPIGPDEVECRLSNTDDGYRCALDDLFDGIHALQQDFEAEQEGIDEAIGMEDDVCSTNDLIVPYEDPTDDDDDDDYFLESNDPRFMDSGWGGECLHDAEDIDFELVYALHTFIATVEGQANATKGDAMVLLDDSNSYWWLVRVVKDSSIGYLPAEHIETPTERLARLNKHRNIDLSATMLGDQSDKAKNPIKTAMRRRKKNVSFAAPTYVDYSDFDYDTEEEEEAEAEFHAQKQQQQQQAQQQSQQTAATKQTTAEDAAAGEEAAKVAPLRPRVQKSVQIVDPAHPESKEESPTSGKNRTSEEIFETNGVEGPKRKADGTVRDSFFKDDTVETKKITLTPNLLRDDGTVRASTDSDKGPNKRPSLDRIDKELREDPKKSKDKKEKEKKGGFRGLFSRKDKKQKGGDDDSLGKRSMDVVAEAPERESDEIDDQEKAGASPQRNPSKLHKQQPRVEPSLASKSGTAPQSNGMDLSTFLGEGKSKNVANVPPASMRLVEQDSQEVVDDAQDESKPAVSRSAASRSESVGGSPPQATTAKSRMQIEDSDSEDDDYNETLRQMSGSGKKTQDEPKSESPVQIRAQPEKPQPEKIQQEKVQQEEPRQAEPQQERPFRPTLPGAFPDSFLSTQSAQSNSTITPERAAESSQRHDRLSESPIEVSPITPSGEKPPALVGDTSSQEDHSSPVSSPSPELIDREEAGGSHRNQDSITTSTSTTTVSNWNDMSLREFFDSGTDIRDLLVVVYDKTDVEPVGPEHPVAGTLFKEQNAKLAEITTQLDHMLGDWLARKQRLRGSV
ncbi:SH3 domain-containing protein [Diaporthe helianthi]|uniref:SH3 domain-containing protein n=1 Tax=Diaporthe helianthi TaxID=158607 RepID=A0A2P5IB95_DIAHE|nr:SH3 domain-containing protein [Diaporthe helianthi]